MKKSKLNVFQQASAKNMSEDELQSQVIDSAKKLGWMVYHTHDSRRSQPGFPDLVLINIRMRKLVIRELKRETGRVSDNQKLWIHGFNLCGIDIGVWRPLDLFDGTILTTLRGLS